MTLVPVLVFATLEIALWAVNYGDSTAFFLDGLRTEGPGTWIDNPDFGLWVFPRRLQPSPQPVPFVLPKVKAPGTYRIFVLGESAAMGFPDPSASFARVLQLSLRARYPETRFEVVNTAMVAINSHVALPIARQCARQQPDLFVVHLGNNEVIGPFGAAGVLGPFSPHRRVIQATLAVKTTRTGQLVDRLFQGLATGKKDGWGGMGMFADSQVRDDDPRLTDIYAHFRENLEDICRVGAEAGIPVVLCTIPVNLRDCAPFASLHAAELADESARAWEQAYKSGVDLEAAEKFAEAIAAYERAAALDERFAELAFRRGRCCAALGKTTEAGALFRRARDLDALRFRSNSTINETIRAVAAAVDGVRLADAERAFAESSRPGVPGEEFFLEHVHMNFAGNYLLAHTVFETLTKPAPAALGPTAPETAAPLSELQCAERLAQTEWIAWKFGTKIYEQLIQGPPFTFQCDHRERCGRWEKKLAAMEARLKADGYKTAIAQYRTAVEQSPDDWMIRMNFGQLLTETDDVPEAKEQYEKVLLQYRHCFTAHYMVGNLELRMKRPRQAELEFHEALRLAPRCLEAHIGLAQAFEQQGMNAEALAIYEQQRRQYPNNAFVLRSLGRFLFRTGKLEEARARLTEALQQEPANVPTHVDLGMTALQLNHVDEAIEHIEAALQIQPEFPKLRDFLAELRQKREPGKVTDRK